MPSSQARAAAALDASLATDYAAKDVSYFEVERRDMLPFVPQASARILDVGCGGGSFGRLLMEGGEREIWGVEPDRRGAEIAARHLHKVVHGLFAPGMDLPAAYFDAVVFNDVLEHMLDPVAALKFARSLLVPGGVVVCSIPNVGNFPIVWRLVMHGEWEYTERGVLDRTHLRFFTRSSLAAMLREAGLTVRQLEGINPFFRMEARDRRAWRWYKLLRWIPIAGLRDMRYLEFAAVAAAAE